MKSLIIRIIVCNLLVTMHVRSCPTCVGRLDVDTPPLFSQEYEKLYTQYDNDTLEIPQERADETQ